MGQNVNYLLGGQNQLLGADPELYRQQLIQQEQARIAAMPQQNQLGATIGGLLGRGIGNLVQDRNFFEVTNPVLQKLTRIQDIYDSSMKEADPNDPMSFYTTLQKNFASAGLGQQAMMAQVEAKKFEETNLKGEKLKTEVYTSNPQLLDAQIAKARAAGDDETANRLAEQRGQIQQKIDLDRSKEAAQIGLIGAQTKQAQAAAQNYAQQAADNKVSVTSIPDGSGGATIIYADKQTGKEVNRISVTSAVVDEYLKKKGGTGGTTTPPGERPPLSSFTPQATPAAASAPTATATPRKVGPVEQMELDRLQARQAEINKQQSSYNQNLAQGRQDVNSLIAVAAQQGYQPMGMQGSEILFIDPRTGATKTSSQF